MRYVPYPSDQTPNYNGTSYQIPTIGQIGYNGYNGYYNQYWNPWAIRQQEEAQRKLQAQQMATQMNIWTSVLKCSSNALGHNYDEELIRQRMEESIRIKRENAEKQQFVDNMYSISQECNRQLEQHMAQQEELERRGEELYQAQFNTEASRKSMYQWLHEDAQERYMEYQYSEMIRTKHNVANAYNSEQYKQMLNVHNSSYASLNPNVTIDDLEIQVSLPERLARERDLRRQQDRKSVV